MTIFVQQLLGTIPGNFAALAALALFCALIGDAALGLLLPGFRRKRLCVALILGGDLMALAALCLNRWLPGASPVEAFAAAAVPAVAAGFWLWRTGRLQSLFSIALHWRRDWLFWLPVTGCIVWYLGSALIPPFSWDEQTYQLAVPAAWLLRGNCAPTADLPYSAFPLMPQFLLLWGMKWSGIGVAKLLVLGVFWILFRMTYDELCHLVPRLAAGILLLVFVVSPVNLFMIREFYAEGFLAVQLLAAVRLRRALAPVFSCRRLAVFGIFAGFAASVKLTGAGTAAAILLAALPGDGFTRPLTFWRNPAHLRALAAFAGAAMLAAMGFYLRPWLALGNPCYPFLAEIFGAPGDTVARYHFLMGDQYYGIGKLPALGLGWIFCAFYDDIYDG
ncbi:MAG: hypothetical protein J6R85_00645, partial [Lentisphaeria bacterium]|nr:hypothetical protein [Lentisphaeria bacterium]